MIGTAIILQLLKGRGMVYGVERVKGLVEFARENLKTQEYKNYKIVFGDGSKGLPEFKPFDRILVGASAKKIPEALLEQLRVGGLMVIPVGNELFSVRKKSRNNYVKKLEEYVSFVPLVEE